MKILKKKKKTEEAPEDILLAEKNDRRMLPNVPDPSGERTQNDRRGIAGTASAGSAIDYKTRVEHQKSGTRYLVSFPVRVRTKSGKKYTMEAKDLSMTGVLLQSPDADIVQDAAASGTVRLNFKIPKGMVPEGMESVRIRVGAKVVRQAERDGQSMIGLQFSTDLKQYMRVRKDNLVLTVSAVLLALISAFILLMRSESIIYFKFNKTTYFYSIVTAVFLLSRYLFGALYHPVPVDPEFTPGVTIIIPCFNEEKWIQLTILNALNQDYPVDKLEVIVIDDCSTDHSVEKIREITDKLITGEGERYHVSERLSWYVQPKNAGKREALARGAKLAKHELVVFVDSDSFLDPYAIRNLVQPFRDPKMGGVSGRTDVANTYTNSLTMLQSVRYYIAFRIMKAAESVFDMVTCLSGPLSCYRKSIILENEENWLNQQFLGHKATFGDDRAMTNFVLRHHRTTYQDTAVCSTIVPNQYTPFLRQQMRWKRSWLRESLICGSYVWRKEPFSSLFFYIGLMVPILAPVIVLYNLIYVPVTQHIFPSTFLMGLLLMALLMSVAQLSLRRSSTWLFGIVFCFYYEMVLLWQMPIAIVTFWKSTWGTRMTESDVKAAEEKKKAAEAKAEAERKKAEARAEKKAARKARREHRSRSGRGGDES